MLGLDMAIEEKLTILSFDEMYLSHQIDFDRNREQVIGPHKTVQVVMARGLISKWKQPIFYKYDTPLTSELLIDIIEKLHTVGFNVVGVVSDMGPTNQGLLKSISVSFKQPNFKHPITGQRVHVFADIPHLIKLCRNNYLDHGFILKENEIETFIGVNTLNELMEISKQDLKLPYKLSHSHLKCTGPMRQKVKLASQFFSNTVATAVAYKGQKGAIKNSNWKNVGSVL